MLAMTPADLQQLFIVIPGTFPHYFTFLPFQSATQTPLTGPLLNSAEGLGEHYEHPGG